MVVASVVSRHTLPVLHFPEVTHFVLICLFLQLLFVFNTILQTDSKDNMFNKKN